MLGLITLGLIVGYVVLLLLLPRFAESPRTKLLIRLVVLSPVIWVVVNGLVGYGWFQVSCAQEGKLTVLESNLPPANVVRLHGWMANSISAEGVLARFESLKAVEAVKAQYGSTTQPHPAYSRYERGPLKSNSWPGRREYELRELPLDVVEVRAGQMTIVEEGKSEAQYILSAAESKRAIRQYVTEMRLLRPDGTLLARDVGIVYLWMDSNLGLLGATSQDSSRCRYDAYASRNRLIGLVAHEKGRVTK